MLSIARVRSGTHSSMWWSPPASRWRREAPHDLAVVEGGTAALTRATTCAPLTSTSARCIADENTAAVGPYVHETRSHGAHESVEHDSGARPRECTFSQASIRECTPSAGSLTEP